MQTARLKILAAPGSVRRAREALSFSAARFPFSIVVPQASRAILRRTLHLSRVFQNELQAKISALLPGINLTGQSDAFGQSAQSIG